MLPNGSQLTLLANLGKVWILQKCKFINISLYNTNFFSLFFITVTKAWNYL